MSEQYDGPQVVGIDLHRRRMVLVRMTPDGEHLGWSRIENDPVILAQELAKAGPDPEVVLEATYGWCWAADVLAENGASVHLAHPLGVKGFAYQRVKSDVRDAADLADLLRMGRLPEAWIAPPATRALREQVRHRAKLVALRSGLKAQVDAAAPRVRHTVHRGAITKQGSIGALGGDRSRPMYPQGRWLAGSDPSPLSRAPGPQHRRRGYRLMRPGFGAGLVVCHPPRVGAVA